MCSSVVRSAFVRRSVASCVAFVLCWFVWRSCAADSPRASDGLLTGGGRAGIRLMPTFCDIPRWAAARRRTCHGRETDWRRVRDNARGCLRTLRVRLTPNLPSESICFLRHIYHRRATDGTWACLRTSDGRATGGLRSDLDKPRRAKMGGGAVADYTRTGNGHATGLSRTIPLRTGNGRHTGLPTGF